MKVPTPSPGFVFWFYAGPALLIATLSGLLLASWGHDQGLNAGDRAFVGVAPLMAIGLLLYGQQMRRVVAAKAGA